MRLVNNFARHHIYLGTRTVASDQIQDWGANFQTCLYGDTSIKCTQETPAALTNRLSAVHSSLRNVSASAR